MTYIYIKEKNFAQMPDAQENQVILGQKKNKKKIQKFLNILTNESKPRRGRLGPTFKRASAVTVCVSQNETRFRVMI